DLVDLRLAGMPAEEARELVRARGHLPHGSIGDATFAGVAREAVPYAERLQALLPADPPDPIAVALEVGSLRLTGSLPRVTARGRIETRPGLIRSGDQIAAWVRHLVLCALAARDRLPRGAVCETHYLGLEGTVVFPPVADAEHRLSELAEAYRRGLCEPL